MHEAEQRSLERALELAGRGRLGAHPNPMVGAVVLDPDGRVLGEGWHDRYGGPHAEVAALNDARSRGNDPRGATLCVTLEPCNHHGKQPPCTRAILEAGIARVVCLSVDPSGKASGRGLEALRSNGVEAEVAGGELAARERQLNQPFRALSLGGRPHVVLKLAVSLDGRTAARSGDSRWISGAESRALVHRWRAEADAVAVGIGTVAADRALLTVRDLDEPGWRQPVRVVWDSQARLAPDAPLLGEDGEVIVLASPSAPRRRVEALTAAGAEVEAVDGGDPAARAAAGLAALARRGIAGLVCEGGATLAGSLLDADVVDEARFFVAPLLIGGTGARAAVGGLGAERMSQARRPLRVAWEQVGPDMLCRATLREW